MVCKYNAEVVLMMEAANTSETLVNFYQDYMALQPRRQPSMHKEFTISIHCFPITYLPTFKNKKSGDFYTT
jgi:hypothetical protein